MHSLGQGCLSTEDNRTSSTSSGRKGSKKVRSGCITCKIRKVKCDEAKPYCLRCTKTGRKCDGYLDDAALAIRRRRRRRACSSSLTDTLTAATQQKTTAGSASAILADAPKLSPAATPWLTAALGSRLPTLQPWESAEEKRSFDFFQHITAPRLAGDLDAVFWRVLVLQICHTEPAVRHAVLAISSLHETFLQTSLVSSKKNLTIETPATRSLASPRGHTTPQHEFALKQYNKAIAHLLDDMKTTSNEASSTGTRIKAASRPACRRPVAPLMTCLLFVCIEMLQGKDKEALIHLGQGRHLLKQLYPNQSTVVSGSSDNQTPQDTDPEMVVIRQHLVPLYTRLSLTSFLLGGNPEPIPAALKTLVAHRIPDTFDSIHALRATVHDFLEAVLRFTRRARPIKYPPTRRRRKSSSSFASYRSSSTLSSSPPTSPLSPSSPSSPISRQSPPASPSFDSDTPQADVPRPEPPRALLYELELEKVALSARLSRLRIALSLFRINQPTMMTAPMSPNAAATILLQIHLYLAEVWLATALARAESAFDAYAETFSTIVSLAVTVLDLEHQQQQKQQTQHVGSPAAIPSSVFTLETNVIPALYYVASKCRHRLVRKSALDVLIHNSHRRENLWRADVLGAIATRIIEMEEDHMWKGGRSKTADFESAVKEEGFQHVDPPRDGSSSKNGICIGDRVLLVQVEVASSDLDVGPATES
ncbi:hypothetical protein SEUCBS140593_004274 [Sporothrix eucalyptigena]|uniref:Zn(2)-C6 fungal-type domain-containing protein n=1 Tax=Sporothrix eucalyptigena TaxID=1812306 RepID=A0ABP0BMW7_9PEZI